VAFTDASTTSGVAIASRIWTFGNGIVLTGNTTTPATTYGTVGTYSVKLVVTDANGCKDSITKAGLVSVVKPTAQFTTVDTFKCPGQQVAFINTSASATSYQWDFGDGTTSTTASPNKTYTTAGTYTVRLIATSAGGCKDTLTRTAYVKIAGGFASFTMSDSVATCPPLSVQFTNTSTQGAYYNWSFGNGTGSILTNPSSLYSLPGIYTVKLKTTNIIGCVDSMSKTVTVNGPYGTIAYSPLSGCAPLSVTLTVNAVNTVLYTYDLNNGVTQTTTSNTYTYSYPNGGLFLPKVVLSNGAGCNVAIVGVDTVKVNKLKTGFIASTQSVCQGTAMQFTDTSSGITLPIATRFWTFGDGTTSTVANPTKVYATAGTYTVKLKVTSGACTDSVTKTITVLPKPTQIVAGGSAICLGGSVNLVATGASTYVWSPSTGLSCTTCFNPVATPTTNTTYTVVGTATNGCSDTSQLTVTINPLPVLTASSAQTICAGASTTLSVSGASTYSWSPSTGLSCTSCASPVASPASTTTYTVTGTDGNGCASTKTVTVNVTPLPVLTTGGTASICVGGSTPLNVAGATTYSWTPATGLSCTTCANPTATPTATTTYIVTGTAQGCSSVANITVTVNPLPTVTATAAPANICLGSSTTLTGTGAASYSWSPSTGLSCATCASTVTSPVATTTYTVTGTSAAGCINTGQVTVTVSPIPAVTATVAQSSICAGSSTTLTASGSTSYSWSPATGLSCVNCSNPTASPATTTTYTVAGSSTAGCASTAQVTVTVKPAPPVTVNPSLAICRGLTAPLQASGAASYSWSPASTLSCSNCANPVASPATTTTYTVTGTGANGCTATASTTVTVNPLPVINAGSDRAICEKTSVPLQATGAQSYVWSPATGLSCTTCASPVATITTPVTYTIVGTDGNGCKDSTTLRLNIVPHIAVSVTPSDTICFGSSRRLEANGGQSYSWSPSIGLDNPTAGAPLASPAITTTYQVVIRENACYTDTLRTTLTVTPVPTVNAGPDQVIFAGSTAHIFGQVTVANQYLWTPADGLSCTACLTPDATPKKTTTYRLEARTGAGCVASDEVTITVRCDNSQIFIPNTFTPNGDGQNDRFYPRGKGLGEVLRFRVYDRWGEVVFEASNFPPNDNTYGWDGTFKGAILKPDTYVWIIETTCESGEILTQKGDISIVR
jgi:gliding motility-associated-like protein